MGGGSRVAYLNEDRRLSLAGQKSLTIGKSETT